ncbi:hypothetical protein OG559_18770 [Micromonospora sp. NBC_01405]|uniref:hypothetical protein n=1 Tax=Micromonospora sp. NBC_01405 TaxID=2903589 RepID=UPI00324BA5AB
MTEAKRRPVPKHTEQYVQRRSFAPDLAGVLSLALTFLLPLDAGPVHAHLVVGVP